MVFFQNASFLMGGDVWCLLKKYQAAKPAVMEIVKWSTEFTEVVLVSYGEPDGRLTRYIQ